jgi:acarbose 7IV-phosphotransferase
MRDHRPVVVAGGFGIDTNVYPLGEQVGVEMTFARVVDAPGQAGCYSARAFAALGLKTRAIAALGDDHHGAWVRAELAAYDIALTELRDPLGTHRSVNLMDSDGTRRNYFDARGAAIVSIDPEACRRTLVDASLLHCHLDDWCRDLLPIAQEAGLLVSCDLQDAPAADEPYRADFVRAADVLFLSAVNLDRPEQTAVDLASRHPGRVVVVGAGAHGCLLASGGHVRRYPALEMPGRPIVDTNGAGDTLAATFLAGHLLEGLDPGQALRRAQVAARSICSRRGDDKVPLSRQQLEELSAAATGLA